MNTLNDNITFLLEEKESNNINTDQLICELNLDLDLLDTEQLFLNEGDELYYNNNYNVKELLIICQYYGISKEVKISKCKKQDISSTIVFIGIDLHTALPFIILSFVFRAAIVHFLWCHWSWCWCHWRCCVIKWLL